MQMHRFQNGVCTACGRVDYANVSVCMSKEKARRGVSRYVLAAREKNDLYALGADGTAAYITENAVSADLLWTTAVTNKNVLSLVNTAGGACTWTALL